MEEELDFNEVLERAQEHHEAEEYEQALSYYGGALEFLLDGEPDDLSDEEFENFSLNLLSLFNNTGSCYEQLGDYLAASDYYGEGVERITHLMEKQPNREILRRYHRTVENLARVYGLSGRAEAALEVFEACLVQTQAFHEQENDDFSWASVGYVYDLISNLYADLGRLQEAYDTGFTMLKLHEAMYKEYREWRDQVDIARAHHFLGEVAERQFKFDKARLHFAESLHARELQREGNPGYEADFCVVSCNERLARLLLSNRDLAAAEPYLNTALQLFEDVEWHENQWDYRLFANLFANCAQWHQLSGQLAEAKEFADEARNALKWLEEANEMTQEMVRVEDIIRGITHTAASRN
ncbi:hypothetical protein FM042_04870 [Aliidiomarina halalkaliphila]|uniref:Tetratricopeptide repeat protein n=1 Tax=Aliidiomarina halalkaliphila TaxID=2593535 RepID=A0A552X5D0_9GAMM|nr:hypothetical protein [Aliidiomarina halalkaliphila]TRW50169.1 hypothetical protein FM042_04870 [Aliidiomarina halalkaliphila]